MTMLHVKAIHMVYAKSFLRKSTEEIAGVRRRPWRGVAEVDAL
jgi:hypothetical protein